MHTTPRSLVTLILLATLALVGTGCTRASKAARHAESADAFYAAGDYLKAEVEYQNTLKLDPKSARSIARLGMIYSSQGRTGRAIAYVMRGHELLPDDLELRVRLGQLYMASGRLEDARKEADFVLTRNPQDAEAPSLWVATMTKPEDADLLRKRLKDLPAPAANGASVLVALASLELRLNHLPEADALLQKAKAAEPANPMVYSVLAAAQLMQKNLPQAMLYFQQAATLSPPRSPRQLQYAQFKIRTGAIPEGKKILQEIGAKTPDYTPAWVALAEVGMMENNLPECTEAVNKALALDPQNVEALVIKGRAHNLKGEYDKAIVLFEKLAETYTRLPMIHQELGRAYAMTGDANKAINSLNQAVALSPNLPEAVLLLARMNSRKGDNNTAANLLKKLLVQYPDLAGAQLLLADVYRAQSNLDGALAIYQQLEKQSPQNNQTALLRGLVLTQQGKTAEARSAYERAFELTPDSPTALEQLINLHLKEKTYDQAVTRLQAEIAKNPKLAGYGQLLLAKVNLARDDRAAAEINLKKAIELRPDDSTAYYLLAGIYSRTNQQDKALVQLNEIVARDPKQSTALMLVAVMKDQKGDYPGARDGYEKMLALNPDSPVALNNLAYLYAERLNDLDKAQELAQKARQLMPNDPSSADTLGWILYQKRQYPRALSLVHDAVEKRPNDAEIQYHLGQIHYAMGEEADARVALQRALELEPQAKWQATARASLAILAIDGSRGGPEAKAALEKALADRPDDPVALARQAMLFERENKPDQAIATWETAFKANAANINVLTNLARLHGIAKHSARALEYAKAARKLAPDDAEVTQFLGRLAYQNGDYQWSFSLLQEAARKVENSPDLMFDLGLTSYSVGRAADAETAVRKALDLTKAPSLTLFNRAAEARQFLDLLALAANPADAVKQSALVEQTLKADPASVPGLMAAGAISEQQNALDAARANYEKALARFPDFSPAKLRLAILGSSLTTFDQKTYDLALQARTAYPTDAQLAKVLGIQSSLKGDNSRALALLKESAASRDNDAVVLYYLGVTQSRLKDAAAAKSLQRAIDLGLKGDQLTEARKILAESKK